MKTTQITQEQFDATLRKVREFDQEHVPDGAALLLVESRGGAHRIAAEQIRQRLGEGYTRGHDTEHTDGELASAAMCYACPPNVDVRGVVNQDGEPCAPPEWPFEDASWKPTPDNRIRELEKAGALIASEIDRLRSLDVELGEDSPEFPAPPDGWIVDFFTIPTSEHYTTTEGFGFLTGCQMTRYAQGDDDHTTLVVVDASGTVIIETPEGSPTHAPFEVIDYARRWLSWRIQTMPVHNDVPADA